MYGYQHRGHLGLALRQIMRCSGVRGTDSKKPPSMQQVPGAGGFRIHAGGSLHTTSQRTSARAKPCFSLLQCTVHTYLSDEMLSPVFNARKQLLGNRGRVAHELASRFPRAFLTQTEVNPLLLREAIMSRAVDLLPPMSEGEHQ